MRSPSSVATAPARPAVLARPPLVALALGALLLLASGPLAAQLPAVRALDGHELAELGLARGEALALQLPDHLTGPLELPLRLDGETQVLRLRPESVRAPGFQLTLAGADGLLRPAEPPAPRTVSGELLGAPGSAAAGSLADGRLRLALRAAPDGELWALQPLPGGEHALYRRSSVVGSAGVCGVFAQPDLLPPDADPDVHPSVSPGDELALTEIALDADHDYYLFHDENEANVVADLETVIALMRLIYINSVAISYEITHINVHTSPTYTTTNPSMLLADFAGLWLSGQYASIPRDVAHLFTDKDLDGFVVGVAYLGQVCDITGAYGLTQSQISANLLLRTGVTSHELGHNWASLHCDGTPDCAIMCSILDACGNGLQTFGGYASAVIAQYAASASCLGVEIVPFVPVLDSVSPTWGPDEGGGVLELHGTTLPADGTLSVSIGSQTAEVLSASETLITVAVPPGPPGTTVDVSVAGDLGLTVLKKSYRYELDVEVGDTVVSEFDVLETERFYFEALADEELTLKLVPLDEEEGLIAGMRLLGPEEQVLVEFEQTVPGQGQPLTLKKFALPSTGVYRLDCFAVGITSGAYKLISKSKPLKKLKTNVAVSTAQPDPSVAFSAHAGTLLKLAHFKRFKPKGKYAEVDGEPADLVPTLLTLMGPEGEVPLGDVLELHKKGKWARVKKLMLHASGDYVLRAGGKDMTVGHGKLRVKLKPPKQDGTEFVLEN